MDDKTTSYNDIIDQLFNQYKDNPYITDKLSKYLTIYLPKHLDKINKKHQERKTRNNALTAEKDKFIQLFLSQYQFFYISNTNYFIHYDGINYYIYNEDDLHYNILSKISLNRVLLPWKHKIKTNIIKLIKDQSIYNTIPESNTIQLVLSSLYPMIVKTKDHAKLFLTIIGDNILKKNDSIIHIINPNMKPIIKQLSNLCNEYLGITYLDSSFKYRYYEHTYELCRLIDIEIHPSFIMAFSNYIKDNILNLLSVACYYSNRYKSSDKFLLTYCNNAKVLQHTLYLKNNSIESIIDDFINEYIEFTDEECYKISWKNMVFLWKQYCTIINIPNILFNNSLRTLLSNKLQYSQENELFLNVTSKQLPPISAFINFWNNNIISVPNNISFTDELELEEIAMLFKNWCVKTRCSVRLDESFVLDLIKHFYPEITIQNDKYILNVVCKLWKQKQDIQSALDQFNEDNNINSITTPISIYKSYQYYCNYSKNNQYIVSKRYFEKYLKYHIPENIKDGHITPTYWSD